MWTIIKKETFDNFLTLRFIIGFVACCVVFGFITYVLVQDFEFEWDAVQSARQDSDSDYSEWETYSEIRPTIVKELSPLAAFGSNMGKHWGKRVWISHTRIPVFTSDETSSGSTADFLGFFYSFDFINVVQIFITLLALLFSFDMISGEKERATLRLMLSNPVQRTTVFIGKFFGSLFTLLPVILASFLISILVYMFYSPASLSGSDWMSMALIILATVLLGAVFIAIGMLVSTYIHRIASSLIVCMIIWVFLVLVLPNAIGFFSSELGFKEDAREFDYNLSALIQEYRDGMNAMNYAAADYRLAANFSTSREGQIVCRIRGENAKKYYDEKMQEALSAQRAYAAARFDLENGYHKKRTEKTRVTNNILRISPSSLYSNIVNVITGTDEAGHNDFIQQARRYREDIIEFIESNDGYSSSRWWTNDQEDAPYRDLINQAETMTQAEMGRAFNDPEQFKQFMAWIEELRADPRRYIPADSIPRFTMKRMSLTGVLGTALTDLFLLILFLAVAITVAYIKFLKYDAR